MQDVIARLRKKPGVVVIDKSESWHLRAVRPDEIILEMEVPYSVLEWFVSARRAATGQEVWSDWMDYYAVDRETEAELRSEMERDVERFVERLLVSRFRVIESKTFLGRRRRLEWQTDGGWERVSLA